MINNVWYLSARRMVRRDDTGRLSYRPFEEYVEVYYLTEFKYKEGNSITSPRPSSLSPCTPPACVSKLDFEYKQEIPPGVHVGRQSYCSGEDKVGGLLHVTLSLRGLLVSVLFKVPVFSFSLCIKWTLKSSHLFYIVLYSIQMQMHGNKPKNNRINKVDFLKYETNANCSVTQLYKKTVQCSKYVKFNYKTSSVQLYAAVQEAVQYFIQL